MRKQYIVIEFSTYSGMARVNTDGSVGYRYPAQELEDMLNKNDKYTLSGVVSLERSALLIFKEKETK